MTDAMVFIVVVMAACTVVAAIGLEDDDVDRAPSELIDAMESTMVRLSDLTDGDDSLVRLTDLMALHSFSSCERVDAYVADILGTWARGRGCVLHVEFTDPGEAIHMVSFGTPGEVVSSSAERTIDVSTGGSVRLVLELYSGPELRGPVGEVEADGDDVRRAQAAHHPPGAAGLAELGGVVTDHPAGPERHGN